MLVNWGMQAASGPDPRSSVEDQRGVEGEGRDAPCTTGEQGVERLVEIGLGEPSGLLHGGLRLPAPHQLHRVAEDREHLPGDIARALTCQPRSEEHTSELQSLMRISYAVFCLKKKKTNKT